MSDGTTETMFSLRGALPWLSDAQLLATGTGETGELGQQAAGEVRVRRVHTDTRTLREGDLFVALQGERFDGNAFLSQARSAGAVAALCSDAAALRQAQLPGLVVGDTRRALGQLAAGWRRHIARGHRLPLMAITGSNGKTTVTQMTAAILRAHKPQTTLATEGNFNNDIGVPLTLLRLRPRHELAVVELGMNHPGEIAQLAAMAQPTVALVNNAQREHQEFMRSIEAVARENGAVLAALSADGVAVYPSDDAYTPVWHELAGPRKRLTFSITDAAADLHCAGPALAPPVWQADAAEGCWVVQASTPAGALRFKLRVAGLHNVKNALAAAACALAAGVPLSAIARGLESFEPVSGRSRALRLTVAGQALTVIDDTYNANPDSVRAAIDVLAGLPGPRLLVLGDMGEVGQEGPRFHAEVGAYARERGIELLHTLGEMSADAAQAFTGGMHHGQDMDALKLVVLATLPQARSVLVKGSRFMKMERVVQAIQAYAAAEKEIQHAASS
jgi:UDP-N-acetylmuramoyl-tripeptide--D-alanyl-D-alanine ligase